MPRESTDRQGHLFARKAFAGQSSAEETEQVTALPTWKLNDHTGTRMAHAIRIVDGAAVGCTAFR